MRLHLTDVTIGYNPRTPVMQRLAFSVSDGEICCILGPNGCGKTTLIKSILGMTPLLSGSIAFNGEDVSPWSAQRLANHVAYVAQQHPQSFPFEVWDVVMMGRTAKTRSSSSLPTQEDAEIVDKALQDMDVYFLRNMPYTDISGGELQLVMFARALAQQPQLLILDEPTAALDYGNSLRVIQKICDMADTGLGVIMVTHNPDHAFLTGANVLLLSPQGPIAFGPAQQVITQGNMERAYGITVKMVQLDQDDGETVRLCAPEFDAEDIG